MIICTFSVSFQASCICPACTAQSERPHNAVHYGAIQDPGLGLSRLSTTLHPSPQLYWPWLACHAYVNLLSK